MRLFGLLGLMLALVIVGLLAKKQLTSIASPGIIVPVASGASGEKAPTVREQSQQMQQQIKQSVEAGMQPRTLPDDN